MDFLSCLTVLNYGLVLIYGFLLSVNIAGGWETPRQKRTVFLSGLLLLAAQGLCWRLLGTEYTQYLYPAIIHLPLVLILISGLKKQPGIALTSVCTAYLCCQLPRWVKLAVALVTGSPLAGELSYTLVIIPIYLLLRRYFVRTAYDAMTYSTQNMFLFGSLPYFYYLFDYATVIYSNALYAGIPALVEFFPTAVIIFYVAFLTAYHVQTQKRLQAELQGSMLETELKQAGTDLELLRHIESQTAIYRHDMRHHLNIIEGYLSAGKPEQASEYIQSVQAGVDAITPRRFCENETVNLLCSAFANKAAQTGVNLTAALRLPKDISIPDTELCSLLSNGLENALHAASQMEPQDKWIRFYCEKDMNKLLIEIKNPYRSEPVMQNGIPVSNQPGHGYGCRSIRTIAERHNGLYSFDAADGIFTLRVVLPLPETDSP